MKMFQKFFGRDLISQKAKNGARKNQLNLSIEPLEERQMLSINSLLGGAVTGSVPSAGGNTQLSINVQTANTGSASLGIVVQSTSTLDPATIQILDSSGKAIADSAYTYIQNGTQSSTIVVSLAKGDYKILVQGDNNTYGSFTCDVFLPGTNNPDSGGSTGKGSATITTLDQLCAQTASIQSGDNWNEATMNWYGAIGRQLGYSKSEFDVAKNQYRSAFDINSDGRITPDEAAAVAANAAVGKVSVTVASTEQITITAAVANPLVSDANTTAVFALSGKVEGTVSAFKAKFTSGPSGTTPKTDLTTVTLATDGMFSLTEDQLKTIFGMTGTVPNGTYKIQFQATGTGDDPKTVTFDYTFEYVAHTRPEATSYTSDTPLYPVSADSTLEIPINSIVNTPGSVYNYAPVSFVDAYGTTHTVAYDTAMQIKNAAGTVIGTVTYTGGTKIGDVYYGGKLVFKPTADQVALPKGADDISIVLSSLVIQDDSGTSENKSTNTGATLTVTVRPVNKTPIVDLSKIQKTFDAGAAAYSIKTTNSTDNFVYDLNTSDTLTFNPDSITVKVGSTSATRAVLESGDITWTTAAGTVITLKSGSQELIITPASSTTAEDITITFTVKDNEGVTAAADGNQVSETATQTLAIKVNAISTKPVVNVSDISFTAAQAQAGNIDTGWTVSYSGTKSTLKYEIRLSGASTYVTIPTDGTESATVAGLGKFKLNTTTWELIWSTVDSSLYEGISADKSVSIQYQATDTDGNSDAKTATATIKASAVAFDNQALYMTPDAPASGGVVSSSTALVVTKPAGTTVAYAILSGKYSDGTAIPSDVLSKFSISADGKITVAEADIAGLAQRDYIFTVKATFTTGTETQDLQADVTLHLAKTAVADGTLAAGEKDTTSASGSAAVSGFAASQADGSGWSIVSGSLATNGTLSYEAHKTFPAGEITLTSAQQDYLIGLIALSKDATDPNKVDFTLNLSSSTTQFTEIFQFLSEGQKGTLTFTYQIKDSTYDLETTGNITLEVTGKNDQPEVDAGSASTNVDTPVTLTISKTAGTNTIVFADADWADTHVITKINDTTVNLSGDEAARTVNTAKGKVVVAADGKSFVYTPNNAADTELYHLREDATTTDTFQLYVKDDSGATDAESAAATVTINLTGTNKAPILDDYPVGQDWFSRNIVESATAIVLQASDYATDPNTGDQLHFYTITAEGTTLTYNGTSDQTLTLASGAILTLKADGTVEYLAGKVPYTTILTDTFTFTIQDDAPTTPLESTEGTFKFNVTGAKHKPQLIDPDDDTTTESVSETDSNTPIDVLDLWTNVDEVPQFPILDQSTFGWTVDCGLDPSDPDYAAKQAELQAFVDALFDNIDINDGDIGYNAGMFNVNDAGQIVFRFMDEVYQRLGEGQSVTFTISYKVGDKIDNGTEWEAGSVSDDTGYVELTINGVNDPPERLKDPLDDYDVVKADSAIGLDLTAEGILSNTNWSDPDFNDNPLSGQYIVDINVAGFNALGTGTLSYDAASKTWTFKPNGDFDYLAAGETALVYIEYTISDNRPSGNSAAGTIVLTVEGVRTDVAAADQSFTYSYEEEATTPKFVGAIAYTHDWAERYFFSINPATIVACDSNGDPLAVQPAIQPTWSLDDNGYLYIVADNTVDWTDVAFYKFEITIVNDNDPTDTATFTATVAIESIGTAPVVAPVSTSGTEGGNDIDESLNPAGDPWEFSALRLNSAQIGGADIPTELFNKLSMMGYIDPAAFATGNFVLQPRTNVFGFIAQGETLNLVFEYVVTDETTGLSSLGLVNVGIAGVNTVPQAFDYEHGTPAPADSTTGIVITVADLIAAHKSLDPDNGAQLTFAKIAGTTIDAAFLAGTVAQRTITLPSGATVIVATDGMSLTYIPNSTADTSNPFYTLKEKADVFLADIFSYVIKDEHGAESDVANITVKVQGVNKAPVPRDDVQTNKKEVLETGKITIYPTDLVKDVNKGDNLQFAFTSVVFAGQQLPCDGETWVVSPNGSRMMWNLDGSLTFDASTHAGNIVQNGTVMESFTYKVTDNSGAANAETAELTHTITVKGLNDTPVGNDYTMPDADAVQVANPASGTTATTTVNVPFNKFFTDPDILPIPDTHTIYLAALTGGFAVVTTAGIRFDEYACTVKLGADGTSLDFVFDIVVGNRYDKLQEGVIETLGFHFYVEDNFGAVSGSATDYKTLEVKVKGINKTPVIDQTKLNPTTVADTAITFRAGDLVTDRNVGDTHVFATINGSARTVGETIEIRGTYKGVADTLLGVLKVIDPATLEFTPDAMLADEIDGLQPTEFVNAVFAFTIRDNSGAANAETVSANMTIKITAITRGPVQTETEMTVSMKGDPGTKYLDLDEYFSGSGLRYTLVSVSSGFQTGVKSEFLTNLGDIEALAGNAITDPIKVDYIGNESYTKSADYSPVILTLKVIDDQDQELDATISIRLEEQYTTTIYIEPTTTPIANQDPKDSYNMPMPSLPDPDADPLKFEVGTTYYLNVWVQDSINGLFGKYLTEGLSGGYMQIMFDGEIATVAPKGSGWDIRKVEDSVSPYPNLVTYAGQESTIQTSCGTPLGQTERLDYGVAPNGWVLMQIPIIVTGTGSPNFTLLAESIQLEFDRFSVPDTDPDGNLINHSQIKFVNPKIEHIDSSSPLTSLTAAEREVDGGIYMRTVTEPTAIRVDGTVGALPDDVNMLHEWESHYVELWVKASDADKYTAANTDLLYNSDYFTATKVELGDYFKVGAKAVIDDAAGLVSGLGGGAGMIASKDGYILLGRVKFESIGTDNVPWAEALTPHSLGLKLENGGVRSVRGEWISELGKGSTTEVWANPYDSNDDGTINFADFTSFASVFGNSGSDEMVLINGFDFNRSGNVNFADFTLFASNFGKTRAAVVSGKTSISLGTAFTQRYIGKKLDADDLSTVGLLLDAANAAWAQALGLSKPIDVQLVVKDYGDSTTLGEALIVALDANGLPSKGIITLDDNAAGLGWYSQLTDPVDASRYDLYTTLLHELGHLYGINSSYNAYNAVKGQYGSVLDGTGHVTITTDVMFSGINTGERKFISELDVNIVETAYGAARGDSKLHGFESTPAQLSAIPSAASVAAVPATTVSLTESQSVLPSILSEAAAVSQNVARLNPSIAWESARPSILPTSENARTLAELNTMGLAVSLPNIIPTGSRAASVDLVFGELFPEDSEKADSDESDYLLADRSTDGLVDQLLADWA